MTRHAASDAAAVVRQNAPSAAIAAALMLYFGFASLAEPTGTALFERSNWIFYHTVRIGGITMSLIAVASWLGYRTVLAVDAVVSTAVGILFVISSGGMLIGGGGAIQNGLLVLFGIMFISAGIRNGRLYASMTRHPYAPPAGFNHPHVHEHARDSDPGDVPASKPQSPTAAAHQQPELQQPEHTKAQPSAGEDDTARETKADQPEESAEGFLAGFARKPPPHNG